APIWMVQFFPGWGAGASTSPSPRLSLRLLFTLGRILGTGTLEATRAGWASATATMGRGLGRTAGTDAVCSAVGCAALAGIALATATMLAVAGLGAEGRGTGTSSGARAFSAASSSSAWTMAEMPERFWNRLPGEGWARLASTG